MVWASTDIVPASFQASNSYSQSTGGFPDDVFVRITPNNSGGTKFDFTAASSAAINVAPAQNLPNNLALSGSTVVPTITAHDATGLTLKLTGAQWGTLFAGLGLTSANASIYASDGTTSLLCGTGRISMSLVP